MSIRFGILFVLLTVCFGRLDAQDDLVTIKGRVVNHIGMSDFTGLYVVNKSLAVGNFANPSGYFEIKAKPTDTILVGCIGYSTKHISVADSVRKSVYTMEIVLHPVQVQLREVKIFAQRDLREIYDDIEQLGFDEREFKLSGINALQSPITALYASFSRREKRLIETYQIINDDRRRELLKELFEKYVAFDIIEMDDDEFDSFIDYCRIDDQTMQRLSQYEFIMLIKKKFVEYRMLNPNDYYWDNR